MFGAGAFPKWTHLCRSAVWVACESLSIEE
jgi:hypothetical protein